MVDVVDVIDRGTTRDVAPLDGVAKGREKMDEWVVEGFGDELGVRIRYVEGAGVGGGGGDGG